MEADTTSRRAQSRRQSSAARIVRELEPVLRADKAGSHTIFDNPILGAAGAGGPRNLRKRKSSGESAGRPEFEHKRRRGSSEVIVLSNRNRGRGDHIGRSTDQELPLTPNKRSPRHGGTSTPRSNRLRLRQGPLLTIHERAKEKFVVAFHFPGKLLDSIREDSRKRRRRDRDRARRARRVDEQPPVSLPEISHYPALQSSSFLTTLYDLHDREGDISKLKPYGGILSESEADTSRTFPQPIDRKKFESARLTAEEHWKDKISIEGDSVRPSQKASGPPSRIKCVHFGGFEMDTLHSSPYPEEYSRNRVLHVCEFCLKYMSSDFVAWRHKVCSINPVMFWTGLTNIAQMPCKASARRRDIP